MNQYLSTIVKNIKIEKITNKEIILSYLHCQTKKKKCFIKLTKWIDGPKGPNVFKENNSSEKYFQFII